MIAVDGDKKVDLENTQLYQKASRSSLTYAKTILQSACCSSQLAVFIKVYLIFICSITAKYSTFSTRPRVLRDQISQEILVGIVIFLCLSKFTSQASLDPNSTSKFMMKQSPLDLEYFRF